MNTLTRSQIAKTAYDNGWEVTDTNQTDTVHVSSALHPSTLSLTGNSLKGVHIQLDSPTLRLAVEHRIGECDWEGEAFHISWHELSTTLRIVAELDRALPDQPVQIYHRKVQQELEEAGPVTTEVERTIKARVGQDVFRASLMDYWGGACAVTGITTPELLRASHIKPWAKCDNDQERLNVFNGLLLAVHIDALFDKGLATFTDDGKLIIEKSIPKKDQEALDLASQEIRLRWVAPQHLKFLHYHRQLVVPEQPRAKSET